MPLTPPTPSPPPHTRMHTLTNSHTQTDGERLPLAVKDLGSSDLYPQSLEHSPNGRFVTVCGDGEYVIYTALAWRNKSFGSGERWGCVWACACARACVCPALRPPPCCTLASAHPPPPPPPLHAPGTPPQLWSLCGARTPTCTPLASLDLLLRSSATSRRHLPCAPALRVGGSRGALGCVGGRWEGRRAGRARGVRVGRVFGGGGGGVLGGGGGGVFWGGGGGRLPSALPLPRPHPARTSPPTRPPTHTHRPTPPPPLQPRASTAARCWASALLTLSRSTTGGPARCAPPPCARS